MGEDKEKKRHEPWKRTWLLILIGAIGVCLVLLGNSEWLKQEPKENGATKESEDPLTAYIERTEQKIISLCEGVRGVSGVQVAVTLEGDFTYIYATERESQERDGVTQEHITYVTVGSGANEEPILLTRTYPRVSGIGIVCRGGGDATIQREILSLLTAAFGVSSNQIYIAEAKE